MNYMESISKSEVKLRDITEKDLPIFFEQQLDSMSNYMAAFTAKDPTDKDAFLDHWKKILLTRLSQLRLYYSMALSLDTSRTLNSSGNPK